MNVMSLKFPKDFGFGFSTAGFQHEMGLPGSEYESDWWVWVHDPENIAAGIVSGDLPENGPGYWHLYKSDHDIAFSLGMDTLRLGIEWARVFPKPTFEVNVNADIRDGSVVSVDVSEEALRRLDGLANRDAVQHYIEIIKDWKDRGGKLIVNLYHWPLPLWVHDPLVVRRSGPNNAPTGWLDPRTVVEFAKYAAYLAWRLGEFVDMWSTMNEPNVVFSNGYLYVKSGFPPGYLGIELMLRARGNLMTAHARAYDALREFSKAPIGIIYAISDVQPLTKDDEEAAKAYEEAGQVSFLDAITKGSGREDLRGRLDWLGINYYSRTVVTTAKSQSSILPPARVVPGYGFACGPNAVSRDGRPCSDFGWELYPEGLYNVLTRYWGRYGLPIIVTENGIADARDQWRSWFIVSHLYQLHRALGQGVDVRGYLHWNLIDNYEWASGFRMKFGLVQVDYNTKKRYLRPSALVFREIARNKEIPEYLTHMIQSPTI